MSFQEYIQSFKEKLVGVFDDEAAHSEEFVRGMPEKAFNRVMELTPLSTFIPEEFGGRGAKTYEALSMLEACSYESLPLSLMMGINGALFLQPLANYGSQEAKHRIFKNFIEYKSMGGLMITEPDFGSDALKMQTAFSLSPDSGSYNIKGLKHWGGLTGWANYWLITARETNPKGELGRDIGFFVHDSKNGGINVEEYYPNLGLYMLPYGKNRINITVEQSHRLNPKSTGINMMLDILHRSRLQFPGMGAGFLHRIVDEAISHCKNRLVGGQNLLAYDQVKNRIVELQSYFTACSAMCHFTGSKISLKDDTSRMDVAANSIKSVVTDLMQRAAQSLLQLVGAKGYRLDHIAGKAVIDSRPFQIFEGSNDILYQQISESVLKMMRKFKENNLYNFLKNYELTQKSSGYFKEIANFNIDSQMPQRKLVELGKAIGRMVTMDFTIDLGETGFNKKLIQNSLQTMQSEVYSIFCTFNHLFENDVVEEYQENSSWLHSVPQYGG